MKTHLSALLVSALLWACSPSPHPIEYGTDKCDFCRMTIVDPQFAAELVTDKGKVYKFDAIECMVQYRHSQAGVTFSLALVSDYLNAGILQEATACTYLVSPARPSPMGANLSAYSGQGSAYASQQGDQWYSWEELLAHFDEKEQHR